MVAALVQFWFDDAGSNGSNGMECSDACPIALHYQNLFRVFWGGSGEAMLIRRRLKTVKSGDWMQKDSKHKRAANQKHFEKGSQAYARPGAPCKGSLPSLGRRT